MECPKCGNEIKEGHLYCDTCGEEIRIVPDFDATVDENINISFTDDIDTEGVIDELSKVATKDISNDINNDATKEIPVDRVKKDKSENDIDIEKISDIDKPAVSSDKFIIKALVLAGAICAVLVFIGVFINSKVNSYYSVDVQYERAFEQFDNGDYDGSIKTLKHALSIDNSDSRLKLLLADNYYKLGKFDESNAVLYELAEDYDDDVIIYEKIITNHIENGDYASVSKLLNEIESEDLKDRYADYVSEPVQFSVDGGSYSSIQNIELYASEGSIIYYTLDGNEATEASTIYTEPIVLDNGEYVINAISVNKAGIQSGNVSKEYIIDCFVPESPVINTKSGVYNVPSPISVSFDEFDICYYTIDGEDPTIDDERYTGPIPMYIGNHEYKFAVITSKGISSEVVTLNVNLELIILIDMDMAVNAVTGYLDSKGLLNQKNSYVCEQACVYNNQTYYIVNEYTKTESEEIMTGNYFAVDVLTGTPYRAIINKATGEYRLEALL